MKRIEKKKIKDLGYTAKDGFIFKAMSELSTPLWTEAVGQRMDTLYLTNYSGKKPISPLVEAFLNAEGELGLSDLSIIAQIVLEQFKNKWSHLADDLAATYDPSVDYDFTEIETPNITHKIDRSVTSDTDSDSKTNTSTQLETKDYSYGIDSGSSGTEVARSLSDGNGEDNETLSEAHSDRTDIIDETKLETGTRTRKKTGRMGKSAIELLKNDYKFWANVNLLNIIFEDTDEILTCPFYYNEEVSLWL